MNKDKSLLGFPRGRELIGSVYGFPLGTSLTTYNSLPVAGAAAWYDAADSSTLTIVSDEVTAWADKSGNGNTASPPSSPNRPGYGGARDRSINGIRVPDFDGGDYLVTGLAGTAQSFTAFAVLVWDGGTDKTVWGTEAVSKFVQAATGVATTQFTYYNGGYNHSVATITSGQAAMYGVASRDTSHRLFHNSIFETVLTSTNANFASAGNYLIGAREGIIQLFDGGIGEIIFWNSELPLNDCRAVVQYLRRKWNFV